MKEQKKPQHNQPAQNPNHWEKERPGFSPNKEPHRHPNENPQKKHYDR